MTNFIQEYAQTLTAEQQQSIGNASDKISERGMHLASINKILLVEGPKSRNVMVEFQTDAGTLMHNEYAGNPLAASDEEIKKSEDAKARATAFLGRLGKAVGFKDINKWFAGQTETKTDKGHPAIDLTSAVKNKKCYIYAKTEIDVGYNDPTKAYAGCVLNSMVFLDKNGCQPGLEARGSRLEQLDADAKADITIAYKQTSNPLCIAKLAQVVEANGGTAPATKAQPQGQSLSGMPSAATNEPAVETQAPAQQPAADVDDDI